MSTTIYIVIGVLIATLLLGLAWRKTRGLRPTTLVVDAAKVIRYSELSKHISDRPDPKVLLREIRNTLKT